MECRGLKLTALPEVADLIARIYEAAVLPEGWAVILEALCRFAGGWGGALVALNGPNGSQFIATDNYAPIYRDSIHSPLLGQNLRVERFLAGRHAGFLRDVDLCSLEELDADPIYRTILHPSGLGWTTGTGILVPSADVLMFDFSRRRADGPFAPGSNAVLDQFRPHLARAALVAARLGLQRALSAVEALESVGLPAAVLRPTGRVLACNGLLEGLAGRIDIRARDRLSIQDGPADALFRTSIEAASAGARPATLSIPVPARDPEPALIVHILPLERAANDLFYGGAFLVAVTPVVAPAAPLTELLSGLFDLTPAEARLARALAGGMNVAGVAASTGLSRETVKKQLQSVFTKTATNRQAELVQLLAAVAPLRRP